MNDEQWEGQEITLARLMMAFEFSLEDLDENTNRRLTEGQWRRFLKLKQKYLSYRLVGTILYSLVLLFVAVYSMILILDGEYSELEIAICLGAWATLAYIWWWYISDWRNWQADVQNPQVHGLMGEVKRLRFDSFGLKLSDQYFRVLEYEKDNPFKDHHLYCIYYLANSRYILSASPLEEDDLKKKKPKREDGALAEEMHLMDAFDFTPNDLIVNMAGRASARQIGRATSKNPNVVVVDLNWKSGLAFLFGGVLGIAFLLYVFGAYGLGIVGLIIFGVLFSIWKEKRYPEKQPESPKIRSLSGRLYLRRKKQHYYAKLGLNYFPLTREQFQILSHRQKYCIYYQPRWGKILSIRRI